MTRKNAVALALAGAVIFGGAGPLSVALMSTTSTKVTEPHAAAGDNYAPGTWHINQDGMRYQVPYPCAYPIGADSGGAEMFQMHGCPLD